ncbi:MAG: hypothetical protein VX527_08955 [Planctomycetota bacterium]|nr:hypothetical protein [Planctomycetota bacterium]
MTCRKIQNAAVPTLGLGSLLGATSLVLAVHAQSSLLAAIPDPCDLTEDGWLMPMDLDEGASNEEWLRFGWESFIAMNWPHQPGGQGGEPNKNLSICDSIAPDFDTAWYTYNQKMQLFQTNATAPGQWSNPTLPVPTHEYDGDEYRIFGMPAKASSFIDELLAGAPIDLFDEAGSNAPLFDQNGKIVLFEIYVNESFWTYIQQFQYYDRLIQKNAVADDAFVGFPMTGQASDPGMNGVEIPDYAQQGAMSVKVSWKQLTDEEVESDRFYTREVYYRNSNGISICSDGGEPVTIGLIGMHILRLTPNTGSTWFWSTFEHVDNVTVGHGANAPATPSLNPGLGSDCPPPYAGGYTCVDSCTNTNGSSVGCAPEEVTETSYPDGVCEPLMDNIPNVSRVVPISTEIEAVNAEYQAVLAGTPWAFYKQINTLQPASLEDAPICSDGNAAHVPNGNPADDYGLSNLMNTCDLTNTSMETYTQADTSCISCHAYATPVLADDQKYNGLPINTEYQVFTFLMSDAKNNCPSDINLSGYVNIHDILYVLDNWGYCEGYCIADVDQDGHYIDVNDLLLVLRDWGACE